MSEQNWDEVELILARLREARKRGKGRIPGSLLEEAARILERSTSTVRRWIKDGSPAEVNRRKSFEFTDLHLRAYHECYGDATAAARLLQARGHKEITVRTFQRGANRLTAYQRSYAKEGPKGARKHRLYRIRKEEGRMVCLEGDHKLVDVHVIKPGSKDKLVRPWITVFIDTKTRVIVGICISLSPTQSDVAACLGSAFRRNPELTPGYGIPGIIRVDRGLEFTADMITAAATMLGSEVIHTPPYTPNKKGKIERVFLTMKTEFFRKQPFYTEGPEAINGEKILSRNRKPITYSLFVSRMLKWVAHYNYKRPHSQLGNKKPAEVWNTDPTIIREATEAELRRFLRRDRGTRKVKSRGVHVNNRWYTAAFLDSLIETEVEIRDVPHDERQVTIYKDGIYLGEAVPHDRLTDAQNAEIRAIKAANAQRSAKVAASITRDAQRRWAGSISRGEPEEITNISEKDLELLTDKTSSDLADQIEKRDKGKKPSTKAKKSKASAAPKKKPGNSKIKKAKKKQGFFDGRDEKGGLK